MNSKLKDIKITHGPHEYQMKCNTCISKGLIVEVNLPKTTLVSVARSDGKGGWLPPTYHCVFHYEEPLDEIRKEIYRDHYLSGEDKKFVDYFNEKKVK
jgi:hypothetical protein